MALPVDLSVGLIVTEALKQAGYVNPSAGLISRAGDEWLRSALQVISKRAELVLYEETKIGLLNPYISRYKLPDDCDRLCEVVGFSGSHTGALQGAGASSVTLDVLEDAGEEFVKGKLLFILSGVAKNEVVRITAYDEQTKLASVAPDFGVIPAGLDSYMIADSEKNMDLAGKGFIKEIVGAGLPDYYNVFGSPPEIYFNKAISGDTKAALKIRYTVFAHKVDLADARMVNIYNELQTELTAGVVFYALMDKDDSRAGGQLQIFENYIFDYLKKNKKDKYSGITIFQPY